MKPNYFKALASIIFISAILMACGKDKTNNGNNNNNYICDDQGCYQTGGANNSYYSGSPYLYPTMNNDIYGNPATTVRLGGVVNITNRGAFKTMLDGWQNCRQNMILFTLSTCGIAASDTPYMEIQVFDYKFSGDAKTSRGTLSIGSMTMVPDTKGASFKRLAKGGFGASVTLPFQYGGASQLVIQSATNAVVTDEWIDVVLKYGKTEVGTARLNRFK